MGKHICPIPFGLYDIKTLVTSPSADMIVPVENIEKPQKSEILPVAICHDTNDSIIKVYPFPYFCLVFELSVIKQKSYNTFFTIPLFALYSIGNPKLILIFRFFSFFVSILEFLNDHHHQKNSKVQFFDFHNQNCRLRLLSTKFRS